METPVKSHKRQARDDAGRNVTRKRVRVESVVPLPERDDAEEELVSHPSLVAFGTTADRHNIDSMRVSVVRKRTKVSVEKTEEDLEMVAQMGNKEWRAHRGYNEMNHDYFIGIRNRRTDTVQLFQVGAMYSMQPFARLKRSIDDEVDASKEMPAKTSRERNEDLLQTFGSRRSKQRYERYAKDRITDDKVDEKAQEQLAVAAKQMMDKDADEGIHHLKVNTTEPMAPPHDNNATTPDAAYPLEGLMTAAELAALEQEAESVIEACSDGPASVENPGWHPLVWNTLIKLVADKTLPTTSRIRRMQAIMHLHYLIVLTTATNVIRREHWVDLMQNMAVDESILRHLLDRFTVVDAGKRARIDARHKSQSCKFRIVVYGILMWLTANGFSNCANLVELSEALSVSCKLLLKHAVQLGCKVRRKQSTSEGPTDPNSFRLSLKVPLKFPEMRVKLGRPARRQ